ncbi:hypothetical protein ACTMS0_28120 [Micromonospora sp. H33]
MTGDEASDEFGGHIGGAGYDAAIVDCLVWADVNVVCPPEPEGGVVPGHR